MWSVMAESEYNLTATATVGGKDHTVTARLLHTNGPSWWLTVEVDGKRTGTPKHIPRNAQDVVAEATKYVRSETKKALGSEPTFRKLIWQ
ncbi:hypothetical protein TM7_0486 [candidate division TM7 genomosp. GTL1]|nr:hypothetical protein TM7_0486 [candidate division TM7 genomosp. GTL1]